MCLTDQHSNAMIAELYEAILKVCAGHAGMLVGVASASGANFLKQMFRKMRNGMNNFIFTTRDMLNTNINVITSSTKT